MVICRGASDNGQGTRREKSNANASATGAHPSPRPKDENEDGDDDRNDSLGRNADVFTRDVDPDVERPVNAGDDEEERPDVLQRCVDPRFLLCT